MQKTTLYGIAGLTRSELRIMQMVLKVAREVPERTGEITSWLEDVIDACCSHVDENSEFEWLGPKRLVHKSGKSGDSTMAVPPNARNIR